MRARLAAVLLGAALGLGAGCSYESEVAEWCELYGRCSCADGECCVERGGDCAGRPGSADSAASPCCAGLICGPQGVCITSEPARLSVSPSLLDLGTVAVGAISRGTAVLSNVGTVPSGPLNMYGTSAFWVDSPCQNRPLGVGETCTVSVTFRPSWPGAYEGTVNINDGRGSARLSVRGTSP